MLGVESRHQVGIVLLLQTTASCFLFSIFAGPIGPMSLLETLVLCNVRQRFYNVAQQAEPCARTIDQTRFPVHVLA